MIGLKQENSLSCDHCQKYHWNVDDKWWETGEEMLESATEAGWVIIPFQIKIDNDKYHTCPECNKKTP